MAIRPKTLWASISPVIIGTAMACRDGLENFPSAFVAFLGAISIQIGTNLINDYYDYKKGADRLDRIGPLRVTQAGLLKPIEIKTAIAFFFLLSAGLCAWLIRRGGWPVAVIGIFSILSGILYTAGRRPLGYLGLGEIFVLIFFGPVAVGGTYYVQSLEINPAVILAGLGPGFLSMAMLVVNNLRDIDGDQRAGKKTLAVHFGRGFAKCEYLFAILGASLTPALVCWMVEDHVYSLMASLVSFFAIPLIYTVFNRSDGPALNCVLARSGQLLFLYSLLFSIGWLV